MSAFSGLRTERVRFLKANRSVLCTQADSDESAAQFEVAGAAGGEGGGDGAGEGLRLSAVV